MVQDHELLLLGLRHGPRCGEYARPRSKIPMLCPVLLADAPRPRPSGRRGVVDRLRNEDGLLFVGDLSAPFVETPLPNDTASPALVFVAPACGPNTWKG